jgi:rhamnosyltransferase
MNPVRVAVLLTAFNGARWLDEQIQSILDQDNVSVTVFISVDRSTDGSEKLVDELAAKDQRIQVLPHGLRFGGAASNFLRLFREVDFSTFDYISLSDQDDIWDANKLKVATELIQSKNAGAYSSNALAFWENGKTALIRKSQPQVEWDYFFEAAGPGCTYVLTKKLALAIQELLKLKPELSKQVGLHDWFIYAFARVNHFKWVIDDHALIAYRQHQSNEVGINSGCKAFARRFEKVSSGWALRQAILLSNLLDQGNTAFVKTWSSGRSLGLLKLSWHSWQCRRRVRDKFFFFFSCLYMALIGGIRP